MTVSDLIVKLSLLTDEEKRMPVMIDKTTPRMEGFVFGSVENVEPITTSLDEKIVIISDYFYSDEE